MVISLPPSPKAIVLALSIPKYSQNTSIPTCLLCPWGFTSAKRGDQREANELGITFCINSFSSSGPKKMFVCNIDEVSTFSISTKGGTGRLRCAYIPAISGVTSCMLTSFSDINEKLNGRSEEHTSELQSRENLVCRLLLEKK